jgi:hypothetical protein
MSRIQSSTPGAAARVRAGPNAGGKCPKRSGLELVGPEESGPRGSNLGRRCVRLSAKGSDCRGDDNHNGQGG